MRLESVYKNGGFQPIGSLIFVFDADRFRNHLAGRSPNILDEWITTFDPPVAYNGFIWIYSPGIQPNPVRYR